MPTNLIVAELEKSIANFSKLEPNFEALIEQISEAAENYEKALINIDKGAEYKDKSLISRDEKLQKADESFKATLLQKDHFLRIQNILMELKDGVRNGSIDFKNASTTLQSKFEEAEEEQNRVIRERNFEQDENYIEFRDKVWKCRNPDEEFLSDVDQNEEEDEDEIRVLRQDIDVKCPLSGEIMAVAYVTACNHFYSAAIFDFIKNGRGETRCAVVGCSRSLRQADVKIDKNRTKEVKKRVKQMEEQERADMNEIEIDF